MNITYDQLMDACDNVHEYDRYFSCTCPFHDDSSPSLLVWQDGWFNCLGCGRKGTWRTLWNALKGWTPPAVSNRPVSYGLPNLPDNMKELEELCGHAHDLLDSYLPSLGWYLEMRNLTDRVEVCKLGWHAGWITVPIYGQKKIEHLNIRPFVGMVMRASPVIQQATGYRYHMPKEQGQILYVPDWNLVESNDYLVIVFGIFDALALSAMRIPVATGTTGQNFSPSMLDWCRKRIIVLPDDGESKKGRELVSALGWRGRLAKIDYPDGNKDPADLWKNNKGYMISKEVQRWV